MELTLSVERKLRWCTVIIYKFKPYTNRMQNYKEKFQNMFRRPFLLARLLSDACPFGHNSLPGVITFLFRLLACVYRASQQERSIFLEVTVSVILRKMFIWTRVLFRTVSDIWRAVVWIRRAIFSFPPAVMRHCLKHVNRCEASVGCCDCWWLVPLF
jgi:hypothetical protein